MITKTKKVAVSLMTLLLLSTGLQVTSKPVASAVGLPAVGCQYTGYFLDDCTAVPNATIYKCVNKLIATNCGYDPTKPIDVVH